MELSSRLRVHLVLAASLISSACGPDTPAVGTETDETGDLGTDTTGTSGTAEGTGTTGTTGAEEPCAPPLVDFTTPPESELSGNRIQLVPVGPSFDVSPEWLKGLGSSNVEFALSRAELDALPEWSGVADTTLGFMNTVIPLERLGAHLRDHSSHVRVYTIPETPEEVEAQFVAALEQWEEAPPVENGMAEFSFGDEGAWRELVFVAVYGRGDYGGAWQLTVRYRRFGNATVVIATDGYAVPPGSHLTPLFDSLCWSEAFGDCCPGADPPRAVLPGCEQVEFPDTALDKEMRKRTWIESGPIPGAAVAGVRGVSPENGAIYDLAGLQCATGLRNAMFRPGGITDLGPIMALPELEVIDATENLVEDLSPLADADLPSLLELELDKNPLSSLSGLEHASLPALRSLVLTSTGISDLGPLAQTSVPELRSLELGGNAIDDLSPLVAMDLTVLEDLFLESNAISDLSPLEQADLPALTRLYLYGNPLGSLDSLSGAAFDSLSTLRLAGCDIDSLTTLESIELPTLNELDLFGNPISSLEGIEAVPSLRFLDIRGTLVTDLSPVASLPELWILQIDQTDITTLAPIAGHPTLGRLDADGAELVDISALATLPSLYSAELQNNDIVDLSPLQTNVWDFDNNCIDLDFTGNPLDAYSLDVVIPALCEQGAQVWYDGGTCGDFCFG